MLKNILSLLLSKFYSKKESELVGHQAMPSSQSISITPTVNSVGDEVATVATFNAQADGFVIVRATTDGAPASRLILSSYVSTYIFNNSVGGTIATFIPIAKGIQCTVQGRNLKNIVISLYKTIGGGSKLVKNALLQGCGLCLNSLSSSLRRSFLSVRRHGSATSLRPSYQGARKSPLSLAPILKTTQRRATELYVSILLTLRGQSSALLLIAGGAYFTARTKQEFIKCSRFLSQRVKRSTLISQRIKAPLISSSFRPLVLNEVKGGASC